MHLVVVHPRLEARGRHFPRSPWSRSRVNLRVLRPLTRGSQGQPSALRTPHGRPGVQGIFPTSRGQVPHGWPMVHHSMATGFPIPRACCLALLAPLPFPCPILPCLIPAPARSHGLPTPSGRCAAPATRPSPPRPLVPSSRVSTPPGRLLPCGAGPLGPLPSRDRFVRVARVAPFPPPSLSPVPRPWPNPPGCLAAPSHPSSRVYTPPGRQQPRGGGPTGSSSFRGPFRAPSTGRSLPAPFPHAAAPAYSPGLSCGPIPSLFPCLYPNGPPATLSRGPTGSPSIRGPFCAPSTGRSPPSPAPLSCAVSLAA